MASEIRSLTFDDEDKIINLVQICIENKDKFLPFNLLPTTSNYENFFKLEVFPVLMDEDPAFGYFNEQELIGMALCSTKPIKYYAMEEPMAVGVIDIVSPTHRRQGISFSLRKRVSNNLKSRGIHKVVLEFSQNNIASASCADKICKDLGIQKNLVSQKFIYNL